MCVPTGLWASRILPLAPHVGTTRHATTGHSTGGRSSIQSAALASSNASTADSADWAEGADVFRGVTARIGAAAGLNPDPCVGEHSGWRHGSCDGAKDATRVPFAVFSGTGDRTEPSGSARADFDAMPVRSKLFADAEGAQRNRRMRDARRTTARRGMHMWTSRLRLSRAYMRPR